jgi:GNAT superfamily N-acetyltransferase
MEAVPQPRIERFEARHLGQLAQLLEAGFGRPFSLEGLRKKYDTAYTGSFAVGFMAFSEAGKPIGYYGLLPARFGFQGRTFIAGQSVDSVIHPEFQGQGLSSILLKMAFAQAKAEGWGFAYGLPNLRSGTTFVPKYFEVGIPLQGLRLPVAKIAWAKALLKLPWGKQGYASFCKWKLKPLPMAQIPKGSPSELTSPAAIRDEAYFTYKARMGNFWVELEGAKAWINLRDGQMLLGELHADSEEKRIQALGQLRKMARKCGCESVVYFDISLPPNLPATWQAETLPAWDSISAAFDPSIDLSRFEMRFSDLDTF